MTDDTKLVSTRGRRPVRPLMGPVMIITVGVLFLIGEFTRYSFGDLWPILLIVAGGVILADTLASRADRKDS